ncbi:MAG: HAD family hydrolase [Actinobacteria bacterium]|nr:HAD family hydrolase [Actinomycetota bacterium]
MPKTPADPLPVVAAFDVDGTLTTRDCVTPFLLRATGVRLALALARHPLPVLRALARRDRDALKAVACTAFAGMAGSSLDELGARFAQDVEARHLRPDTRARLRRHRELGHTVILASASLDPYLEPLGASLGVDAIVCTRLERAPDGRFTGRLVGPNCRAAEKTRRVEEWLAANGLADAELWAYGASPSDRELLARADRPIWVGREPLEPFV